MASSGNIATWNPLDDDRTTVNFSQGNLETKGDDTNWAGCKATFLLSSGKWYWEAFSFKNAAGDADGNGWAGIGITIPNHIINGASRTDSEVNLYVDNGYTRGKGGNTDQGTSWSASDIIGVAYDADNGTIQFLKNNSSVVTLTGSNVISAPAFPCALVSGSSTYNHTIANFGQDSTFGGAITAGGNADGNGFGDFKYAPPSGFLAVCSANLPISDDIDPAQTDTNISEKQCGAVLYTGNGGSNAITGLGFQPDLVWMKQRSSGSTFSNGVVDSSRGASLGTYFNRTNADTDFSSDFSSFDNDGFTLASGSAANINNSGVTFIGWGWKANGGTTSSNSDGSITSSVQANTKAGFSIVTYTGGGSSGTVGHGLNKAPEFVISKKRSGTQSWYALATPFGQGYFNVDGNASYSSGNDPFNSSAPTTTVVGASGNNVTSSATYIYYCWHSVEGFSKFSKFEGNGNADGAFVYTGFRPKMLVIKDGDNSERAWVVYDDKRNTFNPVKNTVGWNLNGSEDTSSYPVDFLSNGFKLRTTNNLVNASSTYFYACWGSVPFRYNNTF